MSALAVLASPITLDEVLKPGRSIASDEQTEEPAPEAPIVVVEQEVVEVEELQVEVLETPQLLTLADLNVSLPAVVAVEEIKGELASHALLKEVRNQRGRAPSVVNEDKDCNANVRERVRPLAARVRQLEGDNSTVLQILQTMTLMMAQMQQTQQLMTQILTRGFAHFEAPVNPLAGAALGQMLSPTLAAVGNFGQPQQMVVPYAPTMAPTLAFSPDHQLQPFVNFGVIDDSTRAIPAPVDPSMAAFGSFGPLTSI